MNGGAAGAAGAAAARARAIKASGVIISMEPEEFLSVLRRQAEPLVVHAVGGFFTSSEQYLTSYKGLAFFTKSPAPLSLPGSCEVIEAQKIWIPG